MYSPLLAGLFALLPVLSAPIHVTSPAAHIDLRTTKVAAIVGEILPGDAQKFETEYVLTSKIPGDRLILIDSSGGLVEEGNKMLAVMDAERAKGVRQVCVVIHEAHSMAFNFLTRCDVRLALPKSFMLMHKVAGSGVIECVTVRCTANYLREVAKDMDKTDEPFRQANAKALHMNFHDYDLFADEQHTWRNDALLKRKYLAGEAEISE